MRRDKAAAVTLTGLASCTSLNTHHSRGTGPFLALPDLSACKDLKVEGLPSYLEPTIWRLQGVGLHRAAWPVRLHRDCPASHYPRATLPEWLSRCTELKKLDLHWCDSLTALPDLSALTSLRTHTHRTLISLTALATYLRSPRCIRSTSIAAFEEVPDLSALAASLG